MSHLGKYTGFIVNFKRKGWKTIYTVAVSDDEISRSDLLLGQFVIIEGTDNAVISHYLGQAVDYNYDPIEYSDYRKALSSKHRNTFEDERAKKVINWKSFDINLLGMLRQNKSSKEMQYAPGIRRCPSLMNAKLLIPSHETLKSIVGLTVPVFEKRDKKPIHLANLALGVSLVDGEYENGSHDKSRQNVPINFDIANLFPKRTAVFGKTGLGKSNLMKNIVYQVRKNVQKDGSHIGQMIFDFNGEYGFNDKSGEYGLSDLFGKEAVIFTNRDHDELRKDNANAVLLPLGFNFFRDYDIVFDLLEMKEGKTLPQYLVKLRTILAEGKSLGGDDKTCAYYWALYAKAVSRSGITPDVTPNPFGNHIYGSTAQQASNAFPNEIADKKKKGEQEDDVNGDNENRLNVRDRNLVLQSLPGRLANISDFHVTGGDVLSGAFDSFRQKKIVIVDLSSVHPRAAASMAAEIVKKVFFAAMEGFTKMSSDFSGLVYIEEAHNLINDQISGMEIFIRLAREGRKFGLGLVYSTQRPTGIMSDILSQTENFFVMHLSSEEDVKCLEKNKIHYGPPVADFLLTEPATGYCQMYSDPFQPFVLSGMIRKFNEVVDADKKPK